MTVNWSRIIGNVGRSLIMGGVLILLFVVYQLWGTAIREQSAQSDLRNEFQSALETSSPGLAEQFDLDTVALPERIEPEAVVPAASTSDEPGAGVDDQPTQIIDTSGLVIDPSEVDFGPPPPPSDTGAAVARIRIPAIDVDKVVVEGVGTNALKNGPGHYPDTPLPGQPGNAAIAGHRTTYGAPFGALDKLEPNDLIYVTTAQGAFQYRVTESMVVSPQDVWVLDPSEDDRLTLTTCHPRFSARERLIVVAELIGPAAEGFTADGIEVGDRDQLPAGADGGEDSADEVPVSITTTSQPIAAPAETTPSETVPSETAPSETVPATSPPTTGASLNLGADDPESPAGGDSQSAVALQGLDGDRAATWPVIFWALAAVFVWILFWYLSHHWRQWPAYLLGTPVFLVVLFMLFENISRLLPSAA
jgi:sortase A